MVNKKDVVFYPLENKVKVYFPALAGFCQEDPIRLLRRYIQAGERLASTNKVHLLIKGVLLASMTVSAFTAILLLSFIPSLAIVFPAVATPLLIVVFCVGVILFFNITLLELAEISAAKREFHIRQVSFKLFLRSVIQKR